MLSQLSSHKDPAARTDKMSERLRVWHIVFTLGRGGMENGIVNVANFLPSEEFDIGVICIDAPGEFATRLNPRHRLECVSRGGRGFSAAVVTRIAEIFKRENPHIVHTHNLGPLIYGALATKAGLSSTLIHGEHASLQNWERRPWKLLQRRLLFFCCCKAIHTVGEELSKEITQLFRPRREVITIRNGVDAERFSPGNKNQAKSDLGLPPECLLVGVVGRMEPHKRHAEVIRAFERIAEANPDAYLLVVGSDSGETNAVRSLLEQSKYGKRILLRPFVQNPEIYYRGLDLLVLPSTIEGISNILLESMACGVPALVHHACGNAEVVEHSVSGVVSDLSTIDSIAKLMGNMLTDQSRLAALGTAARERVEKGFSLQAMAANYAAVYKKYAPASVR